MGGQEEYLDAIQGSRGNYSIIQEQLGLSITTIKRTIREDPVLAQAYEDEYSTVFNLAEDKLIKAIDEEQAWAIKFFLSTKGAAHGYGYKQEIVGGGQVIVLNWSEATTPTMDPIEVIEVTDGAPRLAAQTSHPD